MSKVSKPREALIKCHVEGPRRHLIEEIWRSDDLGLIRKAVQVLPNIPGRHNDKFRSALKQMSG